MYRVLNIPVLAFLLASGLTSQAASAETPGQVLAAIQQEASGTPGFKEFSAVRGENFFKARHGNEWSCSSCHTDNPAATGKHAKTGKAIQPLAPAANAERFSDPKKVDKWFKRNCNDVLDRVCTAQEKGDFLTYLLSVKK